MIEMLINVLMDENFNIRITNEYTKNNLEIDFAKKEINAYDLYTLLAYSIDVKYEVKNNIQSVAEGNEKDYYQEILTIIENIADDKTSDLICNILEENILQYTNRILSKFGIECNNNYRLKNKFSKPKDVKVIFRDSKKQISLALLPKEILSPIPRVVEKVIFVLL